MKINLFKYSNRYFVRQIKQISNPNLEEKVNTSQIDILNKVKINLNEYRHHLRKSNFNPNIEDFAINKDINLTSSANNQTTLINKNSPLLTDIRKKGYFERDPSDTTSVKLDYLYGIKSLEIAINSKNRKILELYIQSDIINYDHIKSLITSSQNNGITIKYHKKEYLDLLTGDRNHNGAVLKVEERDYKYLRKELDFFNIFSNKQGNLTVFLDKIIDPQNFGSILRNCFYYGVNNIVVNKKNRPSLSPTICYSSKGSSEIMDIYSTKKFETTIKAAKQMGWMIITTILKKEEGIDRYMLNNLNDLKIVKNKNIILLLGSESKGIDRNLADIADFNIYIPPGLDFENIDKGAYKIVDSLNVAVTTGIILNHIRKINI